MSAPVRIQRKRTAGWRMPPNTVYVGRGTRWGNPFRVGKVKCHGGHEDAACDCQTYYGCATPEEAVARFRQRREQIRVQHEEQPVITFSVEKWLAPLRGKDLACWCRLDQSCHADVLLELANHPERSR